MINCIFVFLSRTNPAQPLSLLLPFNSACLCPLLARLNNTLAGNHPSCRLVKEVGGVLISGPRSPGGRLRNSCWGCAGRFSKSWPYFRPKNVIFHTRFQTWPLKSTTHSQTWPLRIMSSLLWLEQQQNWNLHISLSFFPFEIETKNTFVHSRSSFETIHVPDSRFQMGKFYTRFQTKAAQIPTL